MPPFESILEQAKNVVKENEKAAADFNERKKFEQAAKEAQILSSESEAAYNEEAKAAKTIRSLGISIARYEEPEDDEWSDVMGVYYCRYGDWVFTVKDMMDPDIEEGILGLYNPKNVKTGEQLDFYCDLWCNNTSKERLQKIIRAMDIGTKAFVQECYGKFLRLPEMLRKAGYEVHDEAFSFGVHDASGSLRIGEEEASTEGNAVMVNSKGCYIRAYRVWFDSIGIAVTNNPKMERRASLGFGAKTYFINYRGDEDFVELCRCVDAFRREMSGQRGFLEDGKFRNETEISKFLKELEKRARRSASGSEDAHYSFEIKDAPAKCPETEEEKEVNLHKGVEAYKRFSVRFKPKRDWQAAAFEGEHILEFEHNAAKNPEACALTLESKFFRFDYNLQQRVEKAHLREELQGTFSQTLEALERFLTDVFEAHGFDVREKA